MHESHCIIDRISPKIPIVRCACFALIVLATVFFMAWYKIDIQPVLVEV